MNTRLIEGSHREQIIQGNFGRYFLKESDPLSMKAGIPIALVCILTIGFMVVSPVCAACHSCEEALKAKKDLDRRDQWFQKALDYYQDGMYEQSINALDQAYMIDDSFGSSVWKKKGECYLGLERYPEAIKAFKRSISEGYTGDPEEYPFFANVWNMMGTAYEKLGKYDEALDAYEQAADLDPSKEKYQENVAKMERRTGNT